MCSSFWPKMENDQGDLEDIVRGGNSNNIPTFDWQLPWDQHTIIPSMVQETTSDDFGDPFATMPDPFVHELYLDGSSFFDGSNPATYLHKMNIRKDGSEGESSSIAAYEPERPCDIFSKKLQILPAAELAIFPGSNLPVIASSPRRIEDSPTDANYFSSSMDCSSTTIHISALQNPGFIKRRKIQAKQVVCIPAPTSVNNRPTAEVVPSDHWAWRKYGQKPIKGSPYPRSYYRCSSSKGCSARKQVERSKTDPNMLVITYTSEHNHPWPTQRNAQSGSTRCRSLNNPSCKSTSSTISSKTTTFKEEYMENDVDNATSAVRVGGALAYGWSIKEEVGEIEKDYVHMINMKVEEYEQANHNNRVPLQAGHSNQCDDFPADLGEMEPEPLNIILSQAFAAERSSEDQRAIKALDPFCLLDCSGKY